MAKKPIKRNWTRPIVTALTRSKDGSSEMIFYACKGQWSGVTGPGSAVAMCTTQNSGCGTPCWGQPYS